MRLEGWTWREAPKLGGVIADRGNNFDLIRLAAAVLVLWGHAPFVSTEGGYFDPFAWISGGREYAGSVAVHVFFLVSGMLISASMERRSARAFVAARFARIWPGYVACVAALVFVAVPLASGLPLLGRAHLAEAAACLRTTAAFPVLGSCGSLAGAFPHSPVPDSFGFPYWTLAVEVHCYAVVLVLGVAFRGRMTATPRRAAAFLAATGVLAAAFAAAAANPPGEDAPFHFDLALEGGYALAPVASFLVGMALYGLRARVPVWSPLALFLAASTLLPDAPPALDYAALVYGVLALAAAKPIRWLRPRHDLSFGVYIYGAAMQQVAVTVTGVAAPWVNFAVATPLCLACAWASWHLVEAPAIALGRRAAAWPAIRRKHAALQPAHGAASGS